MKFAGSSATCFFSQIMANLQGLLSLHTRFFLTSYKKKGDIDIRDILTFHDSVWNFVEMGNRPGHYCIPKNYDGYERVIPYKVGSKEMGG